MTKITLLLITVLCLGCTQAIKSKHEMAAGQKQATFAVT